MNMNTELIVKEDINPIELFTDDNIDPVLNKITRKAKEFIPDISTSASRKEIASMAYKISQSKTFLDKLGKDLVSNWKTKAKQVDASRKHIRDYLDNLRDEIRQPLTDFETEEKRKKDEAKKLAEYLSDWDSAILDNEIFDREREVARKEAELARQEEERKAKEEKERLEKEQIERETQLKKDAEDRARRKAEEKAEREKEEIRKREAKAKFEKEEAEQAAREKQEAIIAERKRAEVEAKRKEHERLTAERIEKERLAAIAADKEHRAHINREALTDLINLGIDEETGKEIIRAIAQGKISHITINY